MDAARPASQTSTSSSSRRMRTWRGERQCTLRLLQGTGVVPKLRCANGHVLVTERVGTPLSGVNLPSDYREQLLQILQMMSAHGVAHNDLWKEHDLELPSSSPTELTVDRGGKLHTSSTSTRQQSMEAMRAKVGVRPTALPPHLSKYFIPSRDEGAMQVLDAMATVNRKLHSYTESIGSGWNVRAGICRLSTGWSLPSRLSCADVTGGEGLFVSTSEPEEPQWTTTMKPETTEASMPTLADLKACMRRCEAMPTLRGRIGVIAQTHVHVVRREATIIGRAVRAG